MFNLCFFLVALSVTPFFNPVFAADVVAHFMVQNAYTYDQSSWTSEITAAQKIGISGFALNWIPPDCESPNLDWQADRINDAFTVAAGQGFKLLYSFDMSYSSCITYWNTTYMASMITKYASSDAMYRYGDSNQILVSTYGGDDVSEYGNGFFQELKDTVSEQGESIVLAPALTTYAVNAQSDISAASRVTSDYPSIDGYLNWQAWPYNVGTNLTTNVDTAFQTALASAGKSGPYIMGVSPWQFKDYGGDSWVEYSDTLWEYRWLDAINTVKPDLIEILTWNDYAESQYIGNIPPSSGTGSVSLGDQANYVNGMDHEGWRIMANYYIAWYKTGSQPTITEDQVVFWYRIHPKSAACSEGSSSVRNSNYPVDAVFAWALVSAQSTISMTVGSNFDWEFTADETGPVMNMVPFPSDLGDGVIPKVGIVRGGTTVQAGNGTQAITSSCDWQNFNPAVAIAGPANL